MGTRPAAWPAMTLIGFTLAGGFSACREGMEPETLAGPDASGITPPGPTPPPGFTNEQIAYTWTGDSPEGDIYLMYANGAGKTRLTNAPGTESEPTWSPDGSKLAFVRTSGGVSQIHVMEADGSQDVNLSNGPRSDVHPVWSPDGQKILFQRHAAVKLGNVVLQDWDVYVMGANGNGKTDLSQYPWAYDGDARWSPDGSQIVFVSRRDGNAEIYRMNADGAANGTRVVTSWGDGPCYGYDIEVVNATGGAYHDLNPCNYFDSDWPAWRPKQ